MGEIRGDLFRRTHQAPKCTTKSPCCFDELEYQIHHLLGGYRFRLWQGFTSLPFRTPQLRELPLFFGCEFEPECVMHKTITSFIEHTCPTDRIQRERSSPVAEFVAYRSARFEFCGEHLKLLRGIEGVLKVGTAA